MKLLIKAMAMLTAVILLSCGNQNKSKPADIELQDLSIAKEEDKSAGLRYADTTAERTSSANSLQSGNPSANTDWDKKIIKTANVTLELKDYKNYNHNIHKNIKSYGAYIANEQESQSDDKIENVITIKVPVAQFEDLMSALPAEGVKVLEKRISTDDVTGEVVDTKSRIEARKQVRDQYLELLRKSKTMKDILQVHKEVNQIQEDIEAGSGRAELLSHEAAFSTVNIVYFQYLTTTPGKDNAPTFIVKLKSAFDDGASIVTGLVLIAVTFWPVILASLASWILYKKYSVRNVKLVKKEQ